MTKALVARFSQTGSTSKLSESIIAGLTKAGWQVDQHAITTEAPPDIDTYDVIAIGSPTYFFRPPFIVTDFVKALPDLKGKASFVFVTHGTECGACGNQLRSQLKAKGARDLGYFAGYGADYWLGYLDRGYLFSPEAPAEAEINDVQSFAAEVAQRYRKPGSSVEPYDSATPFMYALERFLVIQPMAKLFYSKTFRADDKCVGCGTCVEKCPMGNIALGANNKPVFSNACMLCATCELSCPQDAIHSAFDWFIFAPFMTYNINNAKKKHPYVKVEHKAGKINRL